MNKVPAPTRKVFPAVRLEMTEVGAVEARPGVRAPKVKRTKGATRMGGGGRRVEALEELWFPWRRQEQHSHLL